MNPVYPPRRILFPVDFSPRSAAIAPTVAAFARHFHASLTLLHVLPDGATDDDRIRTQEDLAAFGWPNFSGMTACQGLMTGNAADKIIEYIQEAKIDLVMMPTHGYGPFRRFIIGSVALKVLQNANCPVFTDIHADLSTPRPVPQQPDGRLGYRSVVCAVDLAACSRKTMRWAWQFANENGAKLTVVHAIPLTVPLSGPDAPLLDWTPRMQTAAHEAITQLQAEEGVSAPVQVVTGEVEYAIHDAAVGLNAEILVVGRGNEHHNGFRAHTYPIIRHSPCPVISV